MRVLFFGTYDEARHPRVAVLREGLVGRGVGVLECNVPLRLSTADRVELLRRPWRLPVLLTRLAMCWVGLVRRARPLPRPDAVVVGYLGHFDVRLARRLFRRTPIALDHLTGAVDTAQDRRIDGGVRRRLLRRLDEGALRAADVVVVDTEEHRAALPPRHRERALVVAVGAPEDWFAAAKPRERVAGDPLRIVFFGLFTPLQGTATIGRALAALATDPVQTTMIGTGQDLTEARQLAGDVRNVTWIDWVASTELPGLVAKHDVCLGIFGTGPKALRVVPNKVFQGAAAGCAVVTSDTPPQRRLLDGSAVFVAPGDPHALAGALRGLAHDPDALLRSRTAAHELAAEQFTPEQVAAPLAARLATLVGECAT